MEFPNYLGAFDGKHVHFQVPSNSGSILIMKVPTAWILLSVCDADYLFTMVDIGALGCQSDGGIFGSSEMYQKIISLSDIPKKQILPNTDMSL